MIIGSFEVTIKDILSRDTFKRVKVIAGEGGLHNRLKWIHVLEGREFISWLNGGGN